MTSRPGIEGPGAGPGTLGAGSLPRPGRMVLPLLLLFLACGPGGPPGGEGEAAEGPVEGESEVVHVEPANVAAWGLEVGLPQRTTIVAEITLPGILGTNDNHTARIGTLVEGEVAEVLVDLGTRVAAGEILATLNAPEFTRAQTGYLQAYAQADVSRKDYERALVLRDQQAIEEREFLRRQALLEQHLTELRAAEVLLHSLGVDEEQIRGIPGGLDLSVPVEDHSVVEPLLPLRSPLAGVVLTRDAVLGDLVEPGGVLFTVSDLSVLWAHLDAYEHQLSALGSAAEVVIRSTLLPDREFPGRITFVADQVDPELRTVRVRAEVPNRDGTLKPNMYVQGFLRTRDPGRERLVVPADAVQLHEGHNVVFVEMPPEPGEDHRAFEAREVTPGEVLTVGQVILEGLDGSEAVVTKGAFLLKAELTKGAGGHEHVH